VRGVRVDADSLEAVILSMIESEEREGAGR